MTRPALHITIVSFVVVAVLGATAILLSRSSEWGSFTFFIFMAGTIGGVANNIRRLNVLIVERRALDDRTEFFVTLQIYISPLIGGVFGMVLYVVFMSGILQGSLFPTFTNTGTWTTTVDFADMCVPATHADAAKALVWAFLAGFAEGFVPNILDRLVKQSEEERGEVAAEAHTEEPERASRDTNTRADAHGAAPAPTLAAPDTVHSPSEDEPPPLPRRDPRSRRNG